MKTALLLALSAVSVFVATGCAADTDETTGTDEAEVVSASANNGYYTVTHAGDGGFYVKRVNEAKTTCADGKKKAECFVAGITFGGAGLSDREEAAVRTSVEGGHALVKARMYKSGGGTLKANEAWVGATGSDASDTTFFRIADNGIRCITAPCPSTSAYKLNENDTYQLHSTNLENTASPATEEQLLAASAAMGTADGILIGGGVALPKCSAGSNCGPFVNASEFYLRVTHTEGTGCGGRQNAGNACGAGQYCAWEAADICGAADAGGTCQFKPEICPMLYKPVCACDGNTYGNYCLAASAGWSVSSDGACATEPAKCGGIAGLTCADGEFCHFEESTSCGSGDQMGTCEATPDVCPMIVAPVCGCDGNTYGNYCHAEQAGTSVASTGACATAQ
jgi:hypothetical protein